MLTAILVIQALSLIVTLAHFSVTQQHFNLIKHVELRNSTLFGEHVGDT